MCGFQKDKVNTQYFFLLLVPGSLGCLGTVDGLGLAAVDEVEQLVHVSMVNGTGHGRVRVLARRQLLFAPRETGAQLLPDLGVVPAGRRRRGLRRRRESFHQTVGSTARKT